MSYTHARRRGATVPFRRKVPADLRDRFGSHEIVRSIGRASPGEVRRIVHRLWSQTELVFMRVRADDGLTQDEIGRVVEVAIDSFHDNVENAIAEVAPGTALPVLDEPVNRSARLHGQSALYGAILDRNDVVDRAGVVGDLARSVVGKDILRGSAEAARVDGRDPEASLFPEAVSYSVMERDAGPFGSWFGHFRASCGVINPRLDFHAFRHTVCTGLLRAGVPQSHIEEIVGHESENRRSEMGAYNHGMTIELAKEGIDKLVLPIDIDVLNAAVIRSDAVNRSAAWPDFSDPGLVPKPKKDRAKS